MREDKHQAADGNTTPRSVPQAPRVDVKLPSHPALSSKGGGAGGYGASALAFSAAGSFLTPLIVLSVGGWLLDHKMGHKIAFLALLGLLLGLILGTSALMRVLNRMSG